MWFSTCRIWLIKWIFVHIYTYAQHTKCDTDIQTSKHNHFTELPNIHIYIQTNWILNHAKLRYNFIIFREKKNLFLFLNISSELVFNFKGKNLLHWSKLTLNISGNTNRSVIMTTCIQTHTDNNQFKYVLFRREIANETMITFILIW